MSGKTFEAGILQGYAEGAGSTAEIIRNKMLKILSPDITPDLRSSFIGLVNEITTSFGLEPSFWEDMTLEQQTEVVAGKRSARRVKVPSTQEISIDNITFDDDDEFEEE